MKKLFFISLMFMAFSAGAQGIKISQLPLYPISNLDSAVFAGVYNGVTYKIPGYLLKIGSGGVDSTAIHYFTQIDSFHILACNLYGDCDTLIGARNGAADAFSADRGVQMIGSNYRLTDTIEGAGTKFQWLYDKAAFRVGSFSGTQSNIANVGVGSFTAGINNIASGIGCAAIGSGNTAAGGYTFAGGVNNTSNTSSGFVFGNGNTIGGNGSTQIVLGANCQAVEDGAMAMGLGCISSGRNAMSMGFLTKAKSFSSLTIGYYNDSTFAGNCCNVSANNRIFDIGNGTNQTTARNSAMVVMGNARVLINGLSTYGSDPAGIMDIRSTTMGVILPRMTKTQRDAISSPVAGECIYQTDNTPGFRMYNGTNWMRFTETAD